MNCPNTSGAIRVAAWVSCWLLAVLNAPNSEAQSLSERLTEPDAELHERLSLDELILRALTENPELRALHSEWRATLEAGESVRREMPQPRVGYTAYLLAVETRQGAQRHVFSLSQAFPWIRALRDAQDPFIAEADAVASLFDAQVLETIFSIEDAVLNVGRLDSLQELLINQQRVYRDVLDHQSAVLPFVGGDQGDLLRTTLMIEILTDRIEDLGAARATELATVRELARIEGSTSFELRTEVPWAPGAALPALEELVAEAVRRNPSFAALAARGRAESERAEVAVNRALPVPVASVNWGVIATYDNPLPGTGEGGADVLMIGLTVPLPVFRNQYRRAETAHLRSSETFSDQADGLRWSIEGAIEHALIRIEEETNRLHRYEVDILPTAHDITVHYAIEIAQSDGHHADHLLAFEQELRLQVASVEARYAIAREAARIDMLTAGFLTEWERDEDANPEQVHRISDYNGVVQ